MTGYSYTVPLGVTAGADLGMHLGPGLLFLDIRYSLDFGTNESDNSIATFRRNMVSFSLGYKYGLRPWTFSEKTPKKKLK
jgi:hypothetical protein